MTKENFAKGFILITMIGLYVIVSIISTLHVIEFFAMSNPRWLAISLAIAFEVGAAASLASIIMLDKTSKTLVWILFILLTLMQIQGNMFYAYTNLENFKDWIDLFGLQEEELIVQKRILSIVSGAILPIIALGFIKSLVDYMRPSKDDLDVIIEETPKPITEEVVEEKTEEVIEEIAKDIPTKKKPIIKKKPIKRIVTDSIEEIEKDKIEEDKKKQEPEILSSKSETNDIEVESITTDLPIINEAKIGHVTIKPTTTSSNEISLENRLNKRHVYKP
jgi:hypothetical protein